MRVLRLCAATSLLLGCSALRQSEKAVGGVLLPPGQEREIGAAMRADVERQIHPVPLRDLQTYVNEVGQRLAIVSLKDRNDGTLYTFTVLDYPKEANAFALPGGYIYVFSGLVLLAENEAELASVLAHEIGHVSKKHAARQIGQSVGVNVLAALIPGSSIAQVGAAVAGGLFLARNSRDDEREADSVAVGYLMFAGYDVHAMDTLFARLDETKKRDPNLVERFFATHPSPTARRETVDTRLGLLGDPPGALNVESFQAIKGKLRDYSGTEGPKKNRP